MLKNLIIRHSKENKKKCTLQPLRTRSDLDFFTYPKLSRLPDLSNYFVLALEGETLLSEEDTSKGLILIDGTWKLASLMYHSLMKEHQIPTRVLPKKYQTAYPRKQTDCLDPTRGLASVEALYLAYIHLGWDPSGLLEHYYFKEAFLKRNGFSERKESF